MPNTKKWSEIRATRSKPGVIDRANARQQKRSATTWRTPSRASADARNACRDPWNVTVGGFQGRARTDLYVSTLRRYIEAMGGELQIFARFRTATLRSSNRSRDARTGTRRHLNPSCLPAVGVVAVPDFVGMKRDGQVSDCGNRARRREVVAPCWRLVKASDIVACRSGMPRVVASSARCGPRP